MKGLKIVIAVVAAVVVIVVVGMWVLFSKLDSLMVKAIEEAGSHVTGCEVTVEGVEVGFHEGRGSVTGLRIANPGAFSDRDAFQLAEIALDLDLRSARSPEPIVIELIRVASPYIFFEFDERGSSNIDEIRKHAESVAGGSSGESGSRYHSESEAPPVIIRSIQFETGRIETDASALGLEPFELQLPSFALTDVGAPEGVQADQIGKIIILALTRKAAEAVAREKAGEELEKRFGDAMGDKAKGLLESFD